MCTLVGSYTWVSFAKETETDNITVMYHQHFLLPMCFCYMRPHRRSQTIDCNVYRKWQLGADLQKSSRNYSPFGSRRRGEACFTSRGRGRTFSLEHGIAVTRVFFVGRRLLFFLHFRCAPRRGDGPHCGCLQERNLIQKL